MYQRVKKTQTRRVDPRIGKIIYNINYTSALWMRRARSRLGALEPAADCCCRANAAACPGPGGGSPALRVGADIADAAAAAAAEGAAEGAT